MFQTSTTDRIEKQILLKATPGRVWRALSDPSEFGEWFGVKIDGEFVPGQPAVGKITTAGCEKLAFEIEIERMEPEQLFSYRWRPHDVDADADESAEPTTLVVFTLEAAEGGTQLKVVESGFDSLPEDRRADAFRRNEGGWTQQIKNICAYVSTH